MPVCRMRQCEFSTHCRRWRLWQTQCPSFRVFCRPVRTCALSGMRYFTCQEKSSLLAPQIPSTKISVLYFCLLGILSGDQADQSRASAKQPSQSSTLAPAHLHELHLPTQPSHPQISPLPSQEVCVFSMDGALLIKNNIHEQRCNKRVFVAQGA